MASDSRSGFQLMPISPDSMRSRPAPHREMSPYNLLSKPRSKMTLLAVTMCVVLFGLLGWESSGLQQLSSTETAKPYEPSVRAVGFQLPIADVSSAHRGWMNLISSWYHGDLKSLHTQEAVVFDDIAIASLHDLLDAQTGNAPLEYGVITKEEARRVTEMPIHIVSAPKNVDRRREMDARLSRHGFKAWTYHTKWDNDLVSKSRDEVADWMSEGFRTDFDAEVHDGHTKFMEHVEILRKIAAKHREDLVGDRPSWALVLEDDAIMTPYFQNRVAWFTASAPADVDAVYFGGCVNLHVGIEELKSRSKDIGKGFGQRLEPPTASTSACSSTDAPGTIISCTTPADRVTPMLVPSIRSRCASGYAVTSASAGRILTALRSVVRNFKTASPIDHTLNMVFEHMRDAKNVTRVYHLEPPASYETSKAFFPPKATPSENPAVRMIDYEVPEQCPARPTEAAPPPVTPAAPVITKAPSSGAYCDSLCPWERSLKAPGPTRLDSARKADWASYVSPTAFSDMADWSYLRQDHTVNESVAIECLPAGALIYSLTTLLPKFFAELHPRIKHPYFLITGSADPETPGDWKKYLDADSDGTPSKIIHWFGQNGNSDHPHFTGLPIGLNYHEMADALDLVLHGQDSLVEEIQDDCSAKHGLCINGFKWGSMGDFDTAWMLVNFDVGTNSNERGPARKYACGNGTKPGLDYAVCVTKQPGVSQYVSSMPALYHHNSRFRFHLSPPGNGHDCHRTWEAMYLGVIPILKSGPLDSQFKDMPVMIVNKWDEITLDALKAKWDETVKQFHGQVVPKLHFKYWRDRLLEIAVKELKDRSIEQSPSWIDLNAPRRRCWGRDV